MCATVNIHLFEGHDLNLGLLQKYINEINELQASFFVSLHHDICLQLDSTEEIQRWSYLSNTIKNVDNDEKYKIGILSKPIEHNWFSAVKYEDNISFVTTSDWVYMSDLPVQAYLLYEIFQNYQEMRLGKMIAHDETKGCINDMCGYKLDIGFKIKMGWVCQDCLFLWNDCFTSLETEDILKILDYIRLVALNREDVWRISNDYPYPIAVRFRIMQAESNSYIKFQKLIDLYDAIIRYIAFIILSNLRVEDNIHVELRRLKKKVLNDNPTLSTWESIINTFCNMPCPESNFFTETDCESIKRINNLCATTGIRESRNDYCGHNYASQDLTEYLNHYLNKINTIQIALSECDKSIFRFILAKFEKGKPTLTYRRLIGDSMIFDTCTLKVEKAPFDNNHLIIVDERAFDFISVHPYINYAVCCECNHERILFRDGAYSKNVPRYIDTQIGHRSKCI